MITLLYGSDEFRSWERLIALKEEFFKKNASDANSTVFDFGGNDKLSLNKIRSDIFSSGLFSSKKMIIFKNALIHSDKDFQDGLSVVLEEKFLSEDTDIIFWEKSEPKRRDKLFRTLSKIGKLERFDRFSEAGLLKWVEKRAEERGSKISRSALEKLVSFVGDDLQKMSNEIEKLVNFSPKKEIKVEDVDLFVRSKIESNIFETIEALSSRNKNRALKLFYGQLENGDDPFYILSMYIYQFRNLLKIGSFYFKGINDKNIITRETKLHPFVVQKGLSQLRGSSFIDLKKIYRQLESLDEKSKTGEEKIEEALEKFIIKF
ncbi:MAG: DNA polymerase III subunit delta [Candidatus Moranbacteria bacterium]|jgi:DNA polymerase-3 subunit delta|nr:DNA polymerase III subunit delta [Candidatus Moranbacteria bacterium]MDD5651957.1 DNA polymerase III subunit delta [Candidatus Moranbacteria bacterium]MDX9855900.1 DNA polymerase III subunit delta [Candidatus Moranbacteria bacterium]